MKKMITFLTVSMLLTTGISFADSTSPVELNANQTLTISEDNNSVDWIV